MRVKRTGAKRGGSPTFYVQANTDEEREAIRRELLPDVAPWPRRYALAWGLPSRVAANVALGNLRERVEAAVAQVKEERETMCVRA